MFTTLMVAFNNTSSTSYPAQGATLSYWGNLGEIMNFYWVPQQETNAASSSSRNRYQIRQLMVTLSGAKR